MHQGSFVQLLLHIVVAIQAKVLWRKIKQFFIVGAMLVMAVKAIILEGRMHILHLQFFGLWLVAFGTKGRNISDQKSVCFRLMRIMAFYTFALGYRFMFEFFLCRLKSMAFGA